MPNSNTNNMLTLEKPFPVNDMKELIIINNSKVYDGFTVQGPNSAYGKIVMEMKVFNDEHLIPVVLYQEKTASVIVTSQEYMNNRFN